MHRTSSTIVGAALTATLFVAPAPADTIAVGPGESIQAAIDSAGPGDTILVAAGTYEENLSFLGKAVTVVGSGPDTIVTGTGAGPVVTFSSGEGSTAVLDSVLVTGGNASAGGGVLIDGSSPTVLRSVIVGNLAASSGSGIQIQGASAAPTIANNLIIYNERSGGGDPHAVQISNASPLIVNNTIVRNDSNGIFVSGSGTATIMNNILSRNGSRGSATEARRGRGICNFSATTLITYNLFFRNAKSALLQSARDFGRIRTAQRFFESATLTDNVDRRTRFVRRRLPRRAHKAAVSDFDLRPDSRAIGAGDPAPAFDNLDGSRNTIGHSGGPLAAGP